MFLKKLLTFITLTLLTLSPLANIYAQTPASTQDETVRVSSFIVQTEAIVTDKSGRRITGLKASDFTIMDEGKQQNVDYFTAIEGSRVLETNTATVPSATNPAKTEAPVSPLTVPYQGRHIALVFDDLNLSSENFLRSRQAFADYINNKLTPNDMVALVSTSGALASLQQFTNDKQALLSSLNRIAMRNKTTTPADRRPWGMTDDEALRIDRGDQIALDKVKKRAQAEGSDSGPTGTIADEGYGPKPKSNLDPESALLDNRIRNFAKALVGEIGQSSRNNIETLKSLFRGMSDLPGRKIVVLLTEAFGTAGGTSEDLNFQLTQLIEIARRGGLSVYALDAGGLKTSNVTASEHVTGVTMAVKNASPDLSLSNFEQLSAARKLVSGTGGELIANTNSLIAGLERAVEDSNSYYVLGFKPESLDNKFHRLTVTVKGRSDIIVRSRHGYLAADPETIRGTEAELVQALKSPVPLMELPLELVANAVPTSGSVQVITGMHIGRNYLTLPAATAADQTASYEIVSYVFGAGRDKPVAGVVRTITYDLAKEPQTREKLKKEGFMLVPQPFTDLPPGTYQMRAVVREKTSGAIGSAYQFFEVPDLKDRKTITMSSIVLTSAGQSAFNGTHSFKPGSDVDMRYVIFNLPREMAGMTQRVRLISPQGKDLFDSELAIQPPAATATDRTQANQGTRFNLPMARGRYAVIVTLKDAKGKVDIDRRADLVVE